MRITGWHVDAFGTLHDVGVQGLPGGLVVLHGPNEAGKSTLLAFLQRTLFGYPHRNRQDVNHYEPAGGAARGGRVRLLAPRDDEREAGEAEVVVERHDGRGLHVRLPDGAVGGQAALDELVHGADQQLFNAVFAFDLDDLRSIDSLADDAVRDRLFSAGVRGAGRSARAVMDGLEEEARRLWTPRSRTAELDEIQEELGALTRELDEAVRTAAGYPQRLAAERHQQKELVALDELHDELEAEERRVDTLLRAWPAWQRRQEAERELAALHGTPEISEDVLERHERLAAGREAAQQALQQLDDQRRALEQQLAEATVEPRLLELGDELASLDAERSAQHERLERLDACTAEHRRLSQELERAATALGPSWVEGHEPPLEPSIATRGALRDWQTRLDEAHRLEEEAEREARERRRDRDQAARHVEEIDTALASLEQEGPLPAVEEIDRDRERLVQLRVALLQRDATDQARAVMAASSRTGGPPPWLVPAMAAVAVALAVAGVLAAARNATGVLASLLVAALVLLGLAALVRRGRWPSPGPTPNATGPAGGQLVATIDQRAADLGLPAAPGFEDAEAHAVHLEGLRARRLRADQLREARAQAAEHLAETELTHEQARSASEQRTDRARQLAEQWRAWLRDHGLEDGLDPSTVGDLLTEHERLTDRRGQLETLRTEIDELEAAVGRFSARASSVLATAGRRPDPSSADPRQLLLEVGHIAREAATARQGADERVRLEARLDEVQRDRDLQATRLADLERERGELLTATGAGDEAELRELVERSRRRAELLQRIADAEHDLDERLGHDARLRGELESGDREAWAAALQRTRDDRRELQASRDATLEALLEARHRRQEVETSERIADLEQRRATLLAHRDELVERWLVARTARRLIADTLESFERERQPAVLRRAGEHLRQATDGAYRGLQQRGDELFVLDGHQRRCAVDQLSRGTAEQLYLCLRLALAEDLSERGQRLPFVMDDVLVNLDPVRCHQLACLLGVIARQAQVLYFTCHPHLVELLQRVASATVYDLPRGGGEPVPRTP